MEWEVVRLQKREKARGPSPFPFGRHCIAEAKKEKKKKIRHYRESNPGWRIASNQISESSVITPRP